MEVDDIAQFNSDMFFIIFLLYFCKSLPTNALLCMTNTDRSVLTASDCSFELAITDPIPADKDLTSTHSKCALHEADSVTILGQSDGSCYGEVSINYNTKKMTVKFTHAGLAQSLRSPYDDMFGFGNGIRSVVQYKVDGHLEQNRIKLVTRIQCKTHDNCAVIKLRKLLANLTISDARLDIFKEVKNVLHPFSPSTATKLSCMIDGNDDTLCIDSENRCEFDRSKNGKIRQGCTTEDPNMVYNIQYRFNIIEELADHGSDNSAAALKCYFQCKTDNCNNDNNFVNVANLLTSLALASSSTVKHQITYTTDVKPGSPPQPGQSPLAARSQATKNRNQILYYFVYQSIIVQLLSVFY